MKRSRSSSRVKRVVKRRRFARRKTWRSSMKMSRVKRAPTVHSFSRYSTSSRTITLAKNTTGIGGAYTFNFGDILNYSEFTALYDQYKINRITMQFKLHNNPYIWTTPDYTPGTLQYVPITFPTLYIYNDHDDSDAPNLTSLKQSDRVKRFVLKPNSFVNWSVRPSLLQMVYEGALSTAYAPKYNQWIDCGNFNVPHYGTKFYVDYDGATLPNVSGTTGGDITINVEIKYHFSCKDLR